LNIRPQVSNASPWGGGLPIGRRPGLAARPVGRTPVGVDPAAHLVVERAGARTAGAAAAAVLGLLAGTSRRGGKRTSQNVGEDVAPASSRAFLVRSAFGKGRPVAIGALGSALGAVTAAGLAIPGTIPPVPTVDIRSLVLRAAAQGV
jgi:hypothetical protein